VRAVSLPRSHRLCRAALWLLAVGCTSPDATSPPAGPPEVTAASPQVPAATGSNLSVTGKIAFVSDGDLYVMNANGVTRLTNNAANDRQPAWSPDGRKLAFVSNPPATMRST